MLHFLRDARLGLRLLRRSPGFTAVAVLALTFGVAANTAIFSVVYATLLAPMPYPNPDQLVMVWSRNPPQIERNSVSAGDFLDWRRQSTVFQGLHAWSGRGVSLGTGRTPEQLQANVGTPGFLTMMGHRFLLGRDFLEEEGEIGNDQVLVLTHRTWQTRFGGDRQIVGRDLRVDGEPYKVVGVLAPGPADRVQGQEVHMPLAFTPEQNNHDFHWLLVMGRLKPGVTLEQANADMQAVARRIAEVHPISNKGWSASVQPLKNNFLSENTQTALWLLLGAVAFVLLIACANVANLLLARGTARQREVAVRASLGASRRRVFAQFLAESLVLATIGGALGVLLAWFLLDLIMGLMPPFTLPSEAEVALNVPVLLFTLAATMASGVVFGALPAWQATRANLNDSLKEAGRSAIGSQRHRLRRAFVVAEFALALTLLAGGGLAISSTAKLTSVDLGFRTDRLLTFSLPLPAARMKEPAQITTFYEQLLAKIDAVPGVASASASTGMPVQGTGFGMPFYIAGRPVSDPSQRPGAGFNMVTPQYYRTFGITMTRGRAFTDRDIAGGIPVAIVNETFVRRYLPKVDPLTQRIVVEQLIPGVTKLGPAIEWQIVGVHRDIRNGGPRGGEFPEIDVPFAQSPWPGTVMAVRTTGNPDNVQTSVAAIVQSMDSDLPITNVRTMEQLVHESLAGDRFQALLFGSFAGTALLLAALGIYGVMSFGVAQRTHEIGLRMALGAGRADVLRQVLREGLVTALVGAALGALGAYAVGRAMRGMLFDVGAIDPITFTIVTVMLLASATLACLVPARRAASIDPMSALRNE